MGKYYYANKNEKKKYVKIIVKKAPELKRRRMIAWICALSGIVIWNITLFELFSVDTPSASLILGVDKKVTFFGGGAICVGFVLMMLSYCIWHKRFETYGGTHYLREEKYLYQDEEYIEFVYHEYKNMAAKYGEESEELPNELYIYRYPYKEIRKTYYDTETHILTLTGACQFERYCDYSKGVKDENATQEVNSNECSERQFLMCYDGAEEFLDKLNSRIKNTA